MLNKIKAKLKRLKERAISLWYMTVMFAFMALEALYIGLEFLLHLFRIPHWH